MKISLIYPGKKDGKAITSKWEEKNLISKALRILIKTGGQSNYWFPLPILYCKAGIMRYAKERDLEISCDCIDERFDNIDFDQHYDLVGIHVNTQVANRAYEIGKRFRDLGVKTIMGGVHATVLPDEAKQHCDSVVTGEFEEVCSQILDDFRNNNLKPLYEGSVLENMHNLQYVGNFVVHPERYNAFHCIVTGLSKLK
jgi:hypothetical protein